MSMLPYVHFDKKHPFHSSPNGFTGFQLPRRLKTTLDQLSTIEAKAKVNMRQKQKG